jgi:predicted acyltransferase (DUF342 family)
MDLSWSSNRHIRTYFNGFVDISGGHLYLRGGNNGGVPYTNCHLYINNGDISLNGRLYVSGDVSINSRLNVNCDVSLNNRLFVAGDVSLNSRLLVAGDTIIYGRLSVNEYNNQFIINTTTSNYTMIIGEDLSLNGRLAVYLDTSMNSRLFVGGDVSLNSRLIVYSDVSLNNRLYVGGDVSLNSRLIVLSDASFCRRIFIGNDVSLNGNLFVANYLGIGVSGAIYQLGIGNGTNICQLDVSGVSNFRGPVYPLTFADNSTLLTNNREFDFSNNFGLLWTQNPNSQQLYWASIAMSANGQFQLATNSNNNNSSFNPSTAYISNNYGLTWSPINISIVIASNPMVSGSMSSSGQYQLIVTASASASSIYYSSNYGVTWTLVSYPTGQNKNYIFQSPNRYTVSSAISSTGQYQAFLQNVYAGSTYNYYINVSSSYGTGFTQNYSVAGLGTPAYLTSVAISSTGQYLSACGNIGILNSNNFGVTWTTVSSVANFNCIAMSATGQYQYSGVSPGKIYFSNNYGITWTSLGLSPSGNWSSIAVSSNGQYVVASINSGSIYTSNNFGSTWIISNSQSKYWNSVAISSNGGYIAACASNPYGSTGDYIYSSITPYENISISNLLTVYNDSSFNNRLFVGNIANIGGNLNVVGVTNLGNAVNIYGNTTIGTTISNNNLLVNGIGNIATLVVTGTTTLNSTVTINANTSITGTNSLTVNSNTTVGNIACLGTGNINTLIVTGTTTLGDTLTVNASTTIGNSANPYSLTVNGGTTINSYASSVVTVNSDTTIGNAVTNRSLTINGTCTAFVFNANSDYRAKIELNELDRTYSVDNIRPIEYIFKATNEKGLGVIAHELQEHYPCLVSGEKDGEELQSVNYIGIIALLVNEIKGIKNEIKVLKARLENIT